jgi:hypothetical protein
MNELHDMIRVSCEETITPDTEAQMEHEAQQAQPQPSYKEQHGQCEDAPCCGCCGGSMDDGYGSYADDAWHDANEYPDW